jgi:hypothetical protein
VSLPDLTTLDNVKSYAEVAGAGDDTLLTRLISAWSARFRALTDRDISQQTYTETRDGSGGRVAGAWGAGGGATRLLLRNYPVSSVTSVTVDGDAIPKIVNAGDSGWVLKGDVVELVGYRFTPGIQNVVVVYVAGFETTPLDVEQAVIEMVIWNYKARDRMGQNSKSVGGEVISFSSKPWPDSAQAVIDDYRRLDR